MPDISGLANNPIGKMITDSATSMNESISVKQALGAAGLAVGAGALQSIPDSSQKDAQSLIDFRFGTFLRRTGVVNGDTASLINGTVDFIKSNKSFTDKAKLPTLSYSNRFIPIVIQTEFNMVNGQPLYILFDSTPQNIAFTKTANYSPREVLGRPEPIQVYGGSSPITFTLKGMFFSETAKAHIKKLALSDFMFSLVTPSKAHYMPSPVIVRIGDWKSLRCITTNVSVNYMGPWVVEESGVLGTTPGSGNIPNVTGLFSHSPYYYEVDYTFTIVSELNNVKYAEDIIASEAFEPELANSREYKNNALMEILTAENLTLGATIRGNNVSEIFKADIVQYTTTIDPTSIDYAKQLGQVHSVNGDMKAAALAQITSGLSGLTQTGITKLFGDKISKVTKRQS